MLILPYFPRDEIARNINEMVEEVCKDLRDFAEYLRQKQCENDTTNNEKEHNTMEKHEMTAREYLRAQKRMCNYVRAACDVCPFCSECGNDISERGIEVVEQWAAAHPEPKPTIFVPDEIVRITTIEMTQVVPKEFIEAIGNQEFTQKEIEGFRSALRELFKNRYDPDDIHVKIQQFITKGHEQSEEEREDAEKWHE